MRTPFSKEEIQSMLPKTYLFNEYAIKHIDIDIENIAQMTSLDKNIFCDILKNENDFIIRIYSRDRISISKIAQISESFGIEIFACYPFKLNTPENSNEIRFYSLRINIDKDIQSIILESKDTFCEELAFALENNNNLTLNRLSILSQMNSKQIYMASAISAYIKQLSPIYSISAIHDVIIRNNLIIKSLVSILENKFIIRNNEFEKDINAINSCFNINGSDFDAKIINIISQIVRAIVRMKIVFNKTQYIAFKIKPELINICTHPIPYAEIFVYSDSVEGCHVRYKPISRGGFRISDRQDYRTEVLGLMKSQIAKNAIIIPSGAKACIAIKHNKENHEFVKTCYKLFVNAILDITDNVTKEGDIVHPENLIVYDEKDPYIVAAADKGTTNFSDIANEISVSRNFWLQDAFASGGSAGYNHKEMGITSRGAYISIKEHFYELGINPEKDIISAVGIGDMSGDVFGNGILLFKHLKLIASFNHIHIFVDPNPDIQKSYAERKRLFENPTLKWTDYDKSIISNGGGVFLRSIDSIEINNHIREIFDIPEDITKLKAEEFIPYILKARVDLIWNGGIGTFVKSQNESNADAKDSFNDSIRVNGAELRAKVLAEGGNVGLTQSGRVEFAKNGGKIHMDALDNSAGVSCSDHEVNIKLLYNSIDKDKRERNIELAQMQEEVAKMVLNDNKLQSRAISVATYFSNLHLKSYSNIAEVLQNEIGINLSAECIPYIDEFRIMMHENSKLTKPQISTIFSNTKLLLKNKYSNSELLNNQIFLKDLIEYFPSTMQLKYKDAILGYKLKKNIICTSVTNRMVNFGGVHYISRLLTEFSGNFEKILYVYTIVNHLFKFEYIVACINNDEVEMEFERRIGILKKMQDLLVVVSIFIIPIIDFNVNIDNNILKISSNFDKIVTQLKESCCNNIKSSCCFDQEYTSRVKILKNSGRIFDMMKIINKNPTKENELFAVYSKIEKSLQIDLLRNFFADLVKTQTQSTVISICLGSLSKIMINNILYANTDSKAEIAMIEKCIEILHSKNYKSEDLLNRIFAIILEFESASL